MTNPTTMGGLRPNANRRAYRAPSIVEGCSLPTLLAALGELQEIRRWDEAGNSALAYNTDAESVRRLQAHADAAHEVVIGGLAGIGHLLTIAATSNQGLGNADATLCNLGWFIQELASSLEAIDDLRFRFGSATPDVRGDGE